MKKDFNYDNISQYKIDKFAEAWTTLYILNTVLKYRNLFNPKDRQLITGYANKHYKYYCGIFLNNKELSKILKTEAEKTLKRNIEEIYKMGVK